MYFKIILYHRASCRVSCIFKFCAGVFCVFFIFQFLVSLSVARVSFVSFLCSNILCLLLVSLSVARVTFVSFFMFQYLVSFSCVFKCCAGVPQMWVSPTCFHPVRKAQIRLSRAASHCFAYTYTYCICT